MKKKICAKGQHNKYYSYGYYEDGAVTVLAGSSINPKIGTKQVPEAECARNDPEVVSSDFIVLKDVRFKSISTAACFVTGYITNGYKTWRTEDGDAIKKKRTQKTA